MNRSFLSRLGKIFVQSAPVGIIAVLEMSAFFIGAGFFDKTADTAGVYYITVGVVMIIVVLAAMIGFSVCRLIPGPKSDFVSDYDRQVIGNAFSAGSKRARFFTAFELFRNDETDDALDIFRELSSKELSQREKGVLAFYTAICYNRLGYSTNAAHQAVTAADCDVQTPESLLMAARSFNLSASYSSAAEIYERLLPIAEERGIFPFLYNEMGRMYISANDPESSRKAFNKAVEFGLDPVTAQGGLALADLLEGKTEEACERYRLALIARINDTEGYKSYCADICTANGYAPDFFETSLKKRFCRNEQA